MSERANIETLEELIDFDSSRDGFVIPNEGFISTQELHKQGRLYSIWLRWLNEGLDDELNEGWRNERLNSEK